VDARKAIGAVFSKQDAIVQKLRLALVEAVPMAGARKTG